MNFDFEQTLDFVEKRNSKRSMEYYANRKKKRKLHFKQASNNNELPDIISSFPLHIDLKPKVTTNVENNCFLKKQIEENIMEYQDNLDNINQIENINIDDNEIINNSSDSLECWSDLEIIHENLLHYHTDISTKEFCSKLLTLLRNSNTCKLHANRLLSFISSILPTPNNVPNSMEDLLNQLEIENNIFKKYLLCTTCNAYVSLKKKFCFKCSSNDSKTFAFIYDMNIEEYIRNIYIRLKIEIDQYRNQLRLMNDKNKTNDIGFNNLYQQLLKDNLNDNFITFLLHLDGIGLSKSTNLKMWLFSGSIIELRPQLRNNRYNNVLFSFWFSYKEPNVKIWLRNCANLIKMIKMKGIIINENHRINIKFLSITGDSPALSKILNFIGHGGYYCCNFCYVRGIDIGRKRQYFYGKKIFLRHMEKYYKQSKQAETTKENIHGHKGISILQDILDIPLPHAILIDYQHVTLLRHTKTVLRAIYKQLKPSDRERFDNKLKYQSFPHFFNRQMKPFKEFRFIKAVELRNILFYGFLPLSFEFIDSQQLAHFALFICSIRLYHSQPPMFDDKTQALADKLFEQYYKDHGIFYSDIQNYVLHMHHHFGTQYQNYGSLANIGCFYQEDLIGHISKNIHGSNYYSDLIVHYYSIDFDLHAQISHTKYKTISKPIDLNVDIIINDYPTIIQHHDKICTCLNPLTCISIYRRCVIRNNIFHSLIYNKRGKSNSYFISYNKSANDYIKYFGRIILFFSCINRNYAVVQRYTQNQNFSYLFKTSPYFSLLEKPLDNCFSLLSKEPSDLFDIININHVIKHCITFEFQQQLIVTEVSAYHEHD
ncbi:unnamed protein product [Rotaria sordida]|uniref:Uncharacterized protein n=1 Tax=Rotaria sordida TaxID=392033 RepID=A0A814Z6S1_9BILA|nr:unnamed protein product [Rotaria sordida]